MKDDRTGDLEHVHEERQAHIGFDDDVVEVAADLIRCHGIEVVGVVDVVHQCVEPRRPDLVRDPGALGRRVAELDEAVDTAAEVLVFARGRWGLRRVAGVNEPTVSEEHLECVFHTVRGL